MTFFDSVSVLDARLFVYVGSGGEEVNPCLQETNTSFCGCHDSKTCKPWLPLGHQDAEDIFVTKEGLIFLKRISPRWPPNQQSEVNNLKLWQWKIRSLSFASFSGVLYVSDSGNNRIQKLGNLRKNPPEAMVDHPTFGRPFFCKQTMKSLMILIFLH